MSKSYKQLEKVYYDGIQSAENYGYDYKNDKNFHILQRELKKGEEKIDIKNANDAYDKFKKNKDHFIRSIKNEELKAKRKGTHKAGQPIKQEEYVDDEQQEMMQNQYVTPDDEHQKMIQTPYVTPEDFEDVFGEDVEGLDVYDEGYKQEAQLDKKAIKDLIKRVPSIKEDIRKILAKELLKGKITEQDYEDVTADMKENPKKILYNETSSSELKTKALEIAQNEFLKGNIDETEYHRVRAIATQPVAVRGDKPPFVDIVNYKAKKRIIN